MHILSLHRKWKPCLGLGEEKVVRSKYHSGSLQNVESPQGNPKVLSERHEEEDDSNNSAHDGSVDVANRNGAIKRKVKASKQSSEEVGITTRHLNTCEEGQSHLKDDVNPGSTHSDGKQSNSGQNAVPSANRVAKQSQKGASFGRPERSNSCDTGHLSTESPPSKPSRSQPTRARSSAGGGSPKSSSDDDGAFAESSTTKAATTSDPSKESLVKRGVSRSNSNSQARTERGQAAFMDSSQHGPESRKSTGRSRSQDLHEEAFRLFENTKEASATPSTSAPSSNRRMPKGSHQALAAPAQSSQKGSTSSKKKTGARKLSKSSESSQSSTSRTSATPQATKEKDSSDIDLNASSTSLCASKPASERTDCSHGSLPLKEASKPGDPPAKRPQRYRRMKQTQPTPHERPPLQSAAEPKIVKTPSNRFLLVAKDASSDLPSVPQRTQSPAKARKKKATIPPDNRFPEQARQERTSSPKPLIEEEKISEYKSTTKKEKTTTVPGKSSLLSRTSHSASDAQRSNRWDTFAGTNSTVPRPPKSIDMEISNKPSIITNFDPMEWDSDDDSDQDEDNQSMAAASV